MGFRALLLVYVLGGLTFVPLLVAAIVLPAWYLLPRAGRNETTANEKDVDTGEEGRQEEKLASVRKLSGDAAASGTYAVIRRYDFQAALAALNGRQNSTPGAGGNNLGGGEGLAALEPSGSVSSESVYQSMYRSVFTGSKNNGSTTSLLQQSEGDSFVPRRKLAPANLLYIVLRHGHLMLYDSPAQVEVKHVLSLAHYKVSLQAGVHDEGQCDEMSIPEADLFTKRTAIVLTPMELPNGTMQAAVQTLAKPFYLFSATNIDKEDFYHALLSSRAQPPIPRYLEPDALIKFQSSLHSSSLTAESRALDALVGRIFLALHRSESLSGFVRAKLEKKLNRIQKPTFIPSLLVQSIDLGDAGPMFSNFRLRDLNVDGEMTLTADMKYNGGLAVTLLAVAKLDLGTRFKVRTVDLALKTVVQRISGTMLLRIKPPPSNRVWFCFENVPELDVRVEPVVSERKITYGFVLRAIEERVRTAFKEGLVKPNWDDIPMPFSNTTGTNARGGLWSDQGTPDFHVGPSESMLAERNAKSASMPSLVPYTFNSASTGVDTNPTINLTKVRHTVTMPAESVSDRSPRPPRPLRTPSISTVPSTAVDGQNVEPVRSDDASLRALPSKKLWRARASIESPTQKDAVAGLRELQSRAEQLMSSTCAEADEPPSPRSSLDESLIIALKTNEDQGTPRSQEPLVSTSDTRTTARTSSMLSSASDPSTAASSLETNVQSQSKKSNILAATVNATTAAKNWSWNAIQRNRGGISSSQKLQHVLPQQPVGRGMPLPPPGQPLPGPQKGMWGSVGSLRRRPVPSPSHREKCAGAPTSSAQAAQTEVRQHSASSSEEVLPTAAAEFQPWQENSGLGSESPSVSVRGSGALCTRNEPLDNHATSRGESPTAQNAVESQASMINKDTRLRNLPPPLPARPKQSTRSPFADPRSISASSLHASSSSEDEIARAPALHISDASGAAVDDEISATQLPGSSSSIQSSRTSQDCFTVEHCVLASKADSDSYLAAEGSQANDFAEINRDQEVDGDQEDDGNTFGNDNEILSRIRARVKERAPAVENVEGSAANHRLSPSVGFSDGWPSH